MNILFIGDIVGRPGRNAVKAFLPELKEELRVDITLANGENLAAGAGMTLEKYKEMREVGIDYFTGGNHSFHKADFVPHLNDTDVHVLRPANYANAPAGRGVAVIDHQGVTIQLINLIGRAFMKDDHGDYYAYMDELLETTNADIRIVDFHAEATSEKAILGYYLDGKVNAVLGTHTHVPTADERILPKGTAFQTDIGMTGPLHSSLGAKLDPYYRFIRYGEAPKYEVATGPVEFCATLLSFENNAVQTIKRIYKIYEA